jgi:hypothetical protein
MSGTGTGGPARYRSNLASRRLSDRGQVVRLVYYSALAWNLSAVYKEFSLYLGGFHKSGCHAKSSMRELQ